MKTNPENQCCFCPRLPERCRNNGRGRLLVVVEESKKEARKESLDWEGRKQSNMKSPLLQREQELQEPEDEKEIRIKNKIKKAEGYFA